MDMDPSITMILPKGIVINTTDIYQEVAGYPIIPADKIWEYWRVYTVTNKKLKDPTARRLENFWWQVWGSDRRKLSGRALARLFEEISLGPTVVPLHGPANRWEGSDVPPLTKQIIVAHVNREQNASAQRPQPSRVLSNDTSIKSLSSSALKPPPSHPILKKTRSPLAAGPKPTARFVSPPESEDQEFQDDTFPSTAETSTTSTKGSFKPGRSSSAARIPTVMSASTLERPERPKSSRRLAPKAAAANSGAVVTEPALARSRRTSNQQRTGASMTGGSGEEAVVEEQEEAAEDDDRDPAKLPVPQLQLSAKAAGKRPVMRRALTQDRSGLARSTSRPSLSSAATYSLARTQSDLLSPASSRAILPPRNDTDNLSPAGSISDTSSVMGRSMSHNGYARKGSIQGLFTGATATTTNVAAQGQIIDQAGSLPAPSIWSAGENHGHLTSRRPSATSLLESRLTPTQPSQAASVPMGRTRSQLTLLLEREKGRVGEKHRF